MYNEGTPCFDTTFTDLGFNQFAKPVYETGGTDIETVTNDEHISHLGHPMYVISPLKTPYFKKLNPEGLVCNMITLTLELNKLSFDSLQ